MMQQSAIHYPRMFTIPMLGLSGFLLIYFMGNNQSLFLYINAVSAVLPFEFWSHITMFGDAAIVVCLMLPAVGRKPELVATLVVAALLGGVVSHSLKDYLDIPRPPMVFGIDAIRVHGPVHIGDSFPSGHSLTAWIMVSILFSYIHAGWKWGLLLLATLVSISRMALGVHWPQDVIGGMTLGWMVGQISGLIIQRWPQATGAWPQRLFATLLIADAIALFWYHNGHPETFWLQYLLAALCLIYVVPVLKQVYVTKEITHA